MVQQWMKISIILCVFGFLKELRPSEPYVFNCLHGKWFNYTANQITQEIYPLGTYATLVFQLVVFLITDRLRYKPLIITLGLAGVATWTTFIFSTALYMNQILEIFYGVFVSTEVAYYTYIYAKVDREHYQQVTSHTRAAILAGDALSGILAQLLTTYAILDYFQLNYITVSSLVAATIWSLLLPSVETSVYFNREGRPGINYRDALKLMRTHFLNAFTKLDTVKWSLWYALTISGHVQVAIYMQPLFTVIDPSVTLNGAVETAITLFGFLATLLAGHLKVLLKLGDTKSDLMLILSAAVDCALIVTISQTTSIYLCYALYILHGALFNFMLTVAGAHIALNINADSYGLVFGINQFVSLCVSSILTAAIVSNPVGLSRRTQFVAFGCYHAGVGAIYVVMLMWRVWRGKKEEKTGV